MIPRLGIRPSSSSIFLLALALQLPAAARELEPDATLEGFPFSSPASVALSADGRDLYAGGGYYGSPTAGLAWLRRDPDTGALSFQRNYLSAGAEPQVVAVAASPDQQLLHVLTPKSILLFGRGAGGALTPLGEEALPAGFRGHALFMSPLGDRLIAFVRPPAAPIELRAYRRGLAGTLTLEQSFTGVGSGGDFLSNDLFLAGRSLLRRAGDAWTAESVPALADATIIGDVLISPDRRYVYLWTITGSFPDSDTRLTTLELTGGQLIAAGSSEVETNFELELTALAINPASGDIYAASYDTNGGASARIYHYRATDGGRVFTKAEVLFDPNREYLAETAKRSLTFSADGRMLYATFAGEPIAMLEVDETDGKLLHVPRAAGRHSYFSRPFKIVPTAFGHLYALTPNAILKLRWNGNGEDLELLSSQQVVGTGAGSGRPPAIADLVLTPGGGAGALARSNQLVFVERDRDDGELRLLESTAVSLPFGIHQLAISPDGRYVYARGLGNIWVFFLRRDVPKLVPVQVLQGSGDIFRISDDGALAALTGPYHFFTFFERSVETGELEEVPFDYRGSETQDIHDVLFDRQGRLLYLFRANPSGSSAKIEIAARQADGGWTTVQVLPAANMETGWQALGAAGASLYRLSSAGLELSSLTGPAGIRQVDSLAPAELGSVGAPFYPVFDLLSAPLAALDGDAGVIVANASSGNLRLFRRGCGSRLEAGACLQNRRFRVEVDYRENDGDVWPAQALAIGSDDSQIYSFFDETNWEMMVKVLDGCAINGRFWVYAAASTDVAFEIRVTDTWTGERKVYTSAAGAPAPAITDGGAFATCGAPSPGWTPAAPARTPLTASSLLHLGGRFEAKVSWTNHQGLDGQATGLRETFGQPRSGLFYFFSPDNWEMQVKVLNGCGLNDHYWVLGAATTDVGYRLEVFDPVSGLTRTYDNIAGRASPAIIDLEAFPCN